MQRIKNLISPRARRKKLELGDGDTGDSTLTTTPKTFGTPLKDLMARMPGDATVPAVVSRICQYIYKYGVDSVGLFRVNGNARVVERMRMQFELMGDVNLEEENDVAAAAGLLRVFLRDLPDTLVPGHMTQLFFSKVQETKSNKELMVRELRDALQLLPEENYNVLKYISSLLVVVAENQDKNMMSAYGLAILFGPNIFKYELTSGMEALRDMECSKDLVLLFIKEYNALFAEDDEPSPTDFWESSLVKKSPPPRPPPPKVLSLPLLTAATSEPTPVVMTNSVSLDYRPVPSPRKMKNTDSFHSDPDVWQTPAIIVNSPVPPLFSPREDIDHSRPHSPFALESETHSIIESPMITARTHEFVEKTIVETISEHIFGGMDVNQNSGPQSPKSQSPQYDDMDLAMGSCVDLPVVKPRTSLLTKQTREGSKAHTNHKTQQEILEEKGDRHLGEFDDLERDSILTGLKKPSGPPRRSPSRKHRRSWEADNDSDSNGLSAEATIVVSNGTFQRSAQNRSLNHTSNSDTNKENEADHLHHHFHGEADQDGDFAQGERDSPTWQAKSMRRNEHRALSPQRLTNENSHPENQLPSQVDCALSNGIKLFIPPLDLSTLHQHVDGVEPIPVSKDQTDSQMWMKKNLMTGQEDDNVAVISPRSNKLKKRNGCTEVEVTTTTVQSLIIEAPMSPSAALNSSNPFRASVNTDIPPSPPIQQDLYKKHSDDDCSYRLRQLTKKIQGLKKKIKSYEESFEKEHGFKPSHGEKAAQVDIKKYMNELSKARKDLKRLKEDTEKGNRSRHNSGASSSGVELSPPVTPTVINTLDFILRCLKEKRKDSGRPEEVALMSRDQVQDEKLAVQRALLHFEGLHGRPSTREEKDLMRPLYDRYRSVKRMLVKPVSPRNSVELQTVPEDQMMEIPMSHARNPIQIPTAEELEEDDAGIPDLGTQDFGLVTRDFTALGDLDLDLPQESPSSFRDKESHLLGSDTTARSEEGTSDAHLHEMSLVDLHTEIESSRRQKKRLRKILREFEEDFGDKNGRKVQKEDRYPLHEEYGEYKKVKARLRLLEALVLKHHERVFVKM